MWMGVKVRLIEAISLSLAFNFADNTRSPSIANYWRVRFYGDSFDGADTRRFLWKAYSSRRGPRLEKGFYRVSRLEVVIPWSDSYLFPAASAYVWLHQGTEAAQVVYRGAASM